MRQSHFEYITCQPFRNRAGNPAFWLISRIFARTSRITKIAISLSCTETFCSKKLCENVSVSVTYQSKLLLIEKYVKNHKNVHRRHFSRKNSAETSMISEPSNFLIQKYVYFGLGLQPQWTSTSFGFLKMLMW